MKSSSFLLIKSAAMGVVFAAVFVLHSCALFESSEPLEIRGAAAHWVSSDLLLWDAGEGADRVEIRYSPSAEIAVEDGRITGGSVIETTAGGNLDETLADRMRHIAGRPAFTVQADTEVLREAARSRIVAVAYDADDNPVSATRVQFAGLLDDLFAYDGVLGPVYHNRSTNVNLWAPTAQHVSLNIYDADKNLLETVEPAELVPVDGVWRFEGPRDWDRKFYRFDVTVFHHENNEINTFEVTDPYSVSLSTDSYYSQFADLAGDRELKPSGWDRLQKQLPAHTDISVYEAHIRDFSIIDESIPKEHRGTYMAFTHNGKNSRDLSHGMRHLSKLAEAGLTHLHLLPVNDIATVIENPEYRVDLHHPYSRICEVIEESRNLEEYCENYGYTPIREVFAQLAADDPVTKEIQKPYDIPGRYNGMAAHDGFNWGYDPFHFNAPEGSYATDPEGTRRILELRKMVQSLHEIGLKTVVDVVYNHTFASGSSRFSVLDKVVPGYYHRYDADSGAIETSTCCDNTSAEHAMMEKMIIDSVILWAKYYKIDGFRFDLMGHHPRYVMENLTEALAGLTLEEHGVDGKNIYIYGEGWDFGEVAGNRIFEQATQFNMGGTGIGNFNDRSRDGIRGGNFTGSGRYQGFVSGQYLFPNEDDNRSSEDQLASLLNQADRIRVGMTGNLSTFEYMNRNGEFVNGLHDWIGFAEQPQESVNYIDKHDNETFWDNTQTKLPMDMEMDDRVRIHMLGNAMITFGQGVPFYQMGTDILRSKSLDRNSFDSGDWFNAVDFTLESHNWGIGLPPGWDNRDRWDEMIPFLTNPNINVEREHMELASALFREQLQIRYSSPLFRLPRASDIHTHVAFHNTGPDQKPGIIAMTITDDCEENPLDPDYSMILILFNSHIETQTIDLGFDGMKLHPVQAGGVDPVVREARGDGGFFSIPPLTYAVFVRPAGAAGDDSCG